MGVLNSLFGGNNNFHADPRLNQFTAQQAQLQNNNFQGAIQDATTRAMNTPSYDYSGAVQGGQQQALQAGQAQQATGADQSALAGFLGNMAAGNGPSAADIMLKQGQDSAGARAAGAVAGLRGLNPAAAARMILQNQTSGEQQAAQAAGLQKVGEQQQAAQALAGALASQRQGDISAQGAATGLMGAGTQGNLGQQAGFNSVLGTTGGLQQGQNQLTLQNSLGTQQMNEQAALANQQAQINADQLNERVAEGNAANSASVMGSLMGAAGTAGAAAAMSDERQKTDIHDGDQKMDRFLDAIASHSYRYKNPAYGQGERFGPMAQEMEHTEVGHSIVHDTPQGKMLDTNAALTASLAANARLNERVKRLEDGGVQKMAGGGFVFPMDTGLPHLAMFDSPVMHGEMGHSAMPGKPPSSAPPTFVDPGDESAGLDMSRSPDQIVTGTPAPGMARGGSVPFQDAVIQRMQPRPPQGPVQAPAPIPAGPRVYGSAMPQGVGAGLAQAAAPTFQAAAPKTYGAPMGAPQGMGGIMSSMSQASAPAAPKQMLMGGTPPVGGAPATSSMQMGAGRPVAMKSGGQVPGRAQHPGDDKRNDTTMAMLSPGEAVIPRSIMQSEDAPEKAKTFLEHISKQKTQKAGPKSYGDVLRAHRELDERLKKIEAMCNGGMVKR